MIPVGAIGAVVAASLMARRRGKAGGDDEDQRETAVLPMLVYLLVLPLAIGLTIGLLDGPDLRCLPPLVPCLVLLFPWPLTRGLLIPLGLPRLAFCVAALSGVMFQRDRRGGGMLAASWALLRLERPDPAAAAWLERRLRKSRPLRGAGVVAGGLYAVYRGDLDQARAALSSLAHMDPRVAPPLAHRIANEWLAADAAARGEWVEVRRLGHRVKGPRSRATLLLGAIAARFCGDPEGRQRSLGGDPLGPGDALLKLRWAWAPHRLATWPLLLRALGTPRRAPGAGSGPPALGPGEQKAPPPQDRLADALALHAATLRRAPVFLRYRDLHRLGTAWDAALSDPALGRHVLERGLILHLSGSEQVLARFSATLCQELVTLARAAVVCLDEAEMGEEERRSAILGRAARALRDELLAEIELGCDALRRRTEQERALPLLDEWRDWEAMRTQYERAAALSGRGLRRLAWPQVHSDVCALAVWLWNVRREKALANTIFRWLLREAEQLSDQPAIELQQKNVRCGP